MPQVKIAAKFTKDTQPYNGLTDPEVVAALLTQPTGRRYAVLAYEVVRITDEIAEGTRVPTVGTVHIEPLDGEAADTAKQLMEDAYRARTGRGDGPQDPLPFGDGPTTERARDEWLDEKG